MIDRPSSDLPHGAGHSATESRSLAHSIQRAVDRETGYAIRDLSVEVQDDAVLLKGQCRTYYSKQLAQHAAMALPGTEHLINAIEVG